ncbi:unnamed protein product [Arabidopsis halleri]
MVKMVKIMNEKTRITTYKKRKACLYKKASEFSTLCGVDTCLIVYGPSRAGDEMVAEPELWPKDERKVREIITKYRDTVSSNCTKTYTVQECLEKNNTKEEKPKIAMKYPTWDKKLDKCSLNDLYAAFMAVENKIQEATNRNQTFPDTTCWSNDQLGLCGYNQQCFEQYQLFPLPTMEHNGFSFFPCNNQMTSNTAEVASFSNVTEPMIANGQNLFYGSCSDGSYGPVVQRTAYMEPIQWGLGNTMFNNMKQFQDYPFRFAQGNDLEDSRNISGVFAGVDGIPGVVTGDVAAISGASAETGGWFDGAVAGDPIEVVGLIVGAEIGDFPGIVVGGETGEVAGVETGVVAVVGEETGEVKGDAMVRDVTGGVAGVETGDFNGEAIVRDETGEFDGDAAVRDGGVTGVKTWAFDGDVTVRDGEVAGVITGDFKGDVMVRDVTGGVTGETRGDFDGVTKAGEETEDFSGDFVGEVSFVGGDPSGGFWITGGFKVGVRGDVDGEITR